MALMEELLVQGGTFAVSQPESVYSSFCSISLERRASDLDYDIHYQGTKETPA